MGRKIMIKDRTNFTSYPEKEQVQEYGFSNKDINITFTQESFFITEWTVPIHPQSTQVSDQTMNVNSYNYFVSDWDDLELQE